VPIWVPIWVPKNGWIKAHSIGQQWTRQESKGYILQGAMDFIGQYKI